MLLTEGIIIVAANLGSSVKCVDACRVERIALT